MKVLLKNNITNTYPCVLHVAGRRWQGGFTLCGSRIYKYVQLLFIKSQEKHDYTQLEKKLTVVVAHNYNFVTPVEKTLSNIGFNNIVSVGNNVKNWSNILKPQLALDALDNVTTEFVMFLDAIDVYVMHLDNIVERFKQTQCKMLFGGEPYSWPLKPSSKDFPWHENIAKKHCLYKNGPQFLNSGQWIARTNDAKFFLRDVVKVKPLQEKSSSDQGVFKVVFKKYYPDINLDFGVKIFQVASALTSVSAIVKK